MSSTLSSREMTFLAVDIGSNAIRFAVANHKGKTLNRYREPISLGEDVFELGRISDYNLDRCVDVFKKYRDLIPTQERQKNIRVVATAALREATNKNDVCKYIEHETGFKISVIDGLTEAKLIHKAILSKYKKTPETFAIIDIGGGSTELLLIEHHEIKAIHSFPLGSIKLKLDFKKNNWDISDFRHHIRKTISLKTMQMLKKLKHPPQVCYGTGGNPKALGKIACDFYGENKKIGKQLLGDIVGDFLSMRRSKRQEKYKLSKNRAQVILPASMVIQETMWLIKTDALLTPSIGLADGILAEMIQSQ